ncbi:MAG: toxin-antitoxin system TumE family protein [Microcystaceae cyanobacterium]
MIEVYFLQIEAIIQAFSGIRFISLTKKLYNTNQGYISGSIVFENDHRLDFVEVKNTDIKAKIKYRYHYMDEHQVMIFRYDNAPHHAEIKTFPHHKHEVESVKASLEPMLDDVLLEIAQKQRNLSY